MNKSNRTKVGYGNLSNFSFMFRTARKVQKSILILCAVTVVLTICMYLLQLFITPTIIGNLENEQNIENLIKTILFFSVAMLIVDALKTYVNANTIFGRIELRSYFTFKIHDKLATTSYPHTEEQDYLKKLDRASSAVSNNESAISAIWETYTQLVINIICCIIYFCLLYSVSIWIVLFTIGTAILGYFISKNINAWGFRHRKEEAEFSRKLGYILRKAKDRALAKDIRLFGMRQWLSDIYDNTLKMYVAFVVKGEKNYIWANIIELFLAFLRNGVAYGYLISKVLHNEISASEFLLLFSAIGGFTEWINGIFTNLSEISIYNYDISNMREFLEKPEIFKFEDGKSISDSVKEPYMIEFKNVSYRYPGAENNTLSNINIRLREGERLAVVGVNGAGKTTLIKLLCGFIEPTEGMVLLNGRDIRELNHFEYYKLFSAVFQQFSILATTIAANIAQTFDDINMDKVVESAKKAGIDEIINKLPQSYDTNLCKEVFDDAVELSGGEIQRLVLARALYKDAPIVILDEPTAALDPIAESDIYNKYSELTQGKLSVYISHRLASTRFCDRIILLDDGGIKEEGTHEQLLQKNGKYYEMFETQSKYYRDKMNK